MWLRHFTSWQARRFHSETSGASCAGREKRGSNMKIFLLRAAAALLGLAIVAGAGALWYVHTPKFGYAPSGRRLERIQQSPHYKDGAFHTLEPVSVMTQTDEQKKHDSTLKVWYDFIFGDHSALYPTKPLPHVRTDLRSLAPGANVLVWMGHSSFYLQLDGYHILVDPVFGGYASPLPLSNFKAYAGSDIYTPADMPDRIDVMVISHDHWDHLDYDTQMALKERVGRVVTPLGIGEDFEQWGFAPDKILEGDWYDAEKIDDGLTVHVLPSQHFSGRLLEHNRTEWGGFAFVTAKHRVYYSGDGGYGSHFAEIGRRFGGFDFAILEDGQYNEQWSKIHLMPEEVVQAALDVHARAFMPVHNSKFTLARHPWAEPLQRVWKAAQGKPVRLKTPRIGEVVDIDQPDQRFGKWWEL